MPTYTKIVGTGTSVPDFDDYPWINLGNVTADDNTDASTQSLPIEEFTEKLYFTNFGFAIPQNEVIVGVKCEAEVWADTEMGEEQDSGILKGGSEVGSNLSGWSGAWPEQRLVEVIGGPTSLHSLTFTPAEVNDNGFGFWIRGETIADDTAFFCDFARMTIYTEVETDALFLAGTI